MIPLLLATAFVLTACGHNESDGHTHGEKESQSHEEESPSGADFKTGKGVMLTDETRQILGVEVAEVAEQKLPRQIRLNVQMFGGAHHHAIRTNHRPGRYVYGSGFVPLDQAEGLRANQPIEIMALTNELTTGVVVSVEKALALGESEVIVGFTNATEKLKPGEFLPATITLPRDEAVAVIPRQALLRTAEGSFVFVVNGDAFLRTPVKVGSEANGLLEITDGLFSGDAVVTKPVETLYLIELRATKGGGHCH